MALKVGNIICKYLYIYSYCTLFTVSSFNSVQTGSYINASSQLWTGIMVCLFCMYPYFGNHTCSHVMACDFGTCSCEIYVREI